MDGDSEFWDKNSLDSSEFDFENADDDESLQSIEDLIDWIIVSRIEINQKLRHSGHIIYVQWSF